MGHFYNACFGMIPCDYNTDLSTYLLICLYKLAGGFVGADAIHRQNTPPVNKFFKTPKKFLLPKST